MKQCHIKSLIPKAALGATLIGNELLAQTSGPIISWTPYASVPLDRMSSIVMAVAFVLIGAWLLHKSRKPVQQFLVAAVMVSGVYQYALDAGGAEPVPMSATGNKTLSCGAYYLLQNSEGGQLQVTGNSGATCVFQPAVTAPKLRIDFPYCEILNNSSSFTLIMEKDTSCYLLTTGTGTDPV